MLKFSGLAFILQEIGEKLDYEYFLLSFRPAKAGRYAKIHRFQFFGNASSNRQSPIPIYYFQPSCVSTHLRANQYHKAANRKINPSQNLRTTETTAIAMQSHINANADLRVFNPHKPRLTSIGLFGLVSCESFIYVTLMD